MNLGLIWTKDTNAYAAMTGTKSTLGGRLQTKDSGSVVLTEAYYGDVGTSVGNVKDELDVNTGVKTQRNSGLTNVATTVYNSLDKTTYTNVDVVKTTAFALAKVGTAAVDGFTRYWNSAGTELTEIAAANIDLAASVGKYYYHTDKTVWIFVTPDLYADIAAARTGLGTSTVNYNLAAEVTTYTDPQILIAEANGALIFEPIPKHTVVYSGGITIPNIAVPFRSTTVTNEFTSNKNSATGLSKVTSINGVLSYADVALTAVTIAGGLTTFTISGAVDGETYEYTRYYDSALSTNPECTYSHPLNLKAAVEGNTDMIAVVDDKVDDLERFTVAMFLQVVGLPFTLAYQVEDLAAGVDIADRILMDVPTGYLITLTTAKIISFGAPAGIDAGNTCVITLTDGTNTIVTKTYNDATVFPTSAVGDLGTLSATYKTLSAAELLKLSITNGATANPPAFIVQVRYTMIKN